MKIYRTASGHCVEHDGVVRLVEGDLFSRTWKPGAEIPDGLTTHRHPVRVETGFGYSRGQTMVDRRESLVDRVRLPGHLPPTPVDVAEHVDARGYAQLWVRTLLG